MTSRDAEWNIYIYIISNLNVFCFSLDVELIKIIRNSHLNTDRHYRSNSFAAFYTMDSNSILANGLIRVLNYKINVVNLGSSSI